MMSKPRKFLWSQTDILPKRHISETVRFCLSLRHSQSYSRGHRSKTRICFLYLNISMMKMEILTSRKFDKILISFKMFTFLNNLYFLLLCCKNFFVLQKIFPNFQNGKFLLWTVQFTSRNLKTCKYLKMKICLISYGSFHLSKS